MKIRCLIITLLMLCLCLCAAAAPLDGGSTMQSAPAIGTDVQYIGSMEGAKEEWYAFRAEEGPAYYRADFKNEDIATTLYMTVFNSDGIKIEDTSASREQSSYISWKVVPGETYYLRFTRYSDSKSGRFTVSLTRTPDAYANSTEGAGTIAVGQTVLTSFDGTGDVDVLTFTAAEGQAYYRADFKNETVNTTVYMTLLDENGLKITDERASKDSSGYISWLAEPGKTYYLQFSLYDKHRSGNYTVSLSRMPDDEGQDLASAIPLTGEQPVFGSFDGTGDVDFLTFTAAEGRAYYRADFKNETVNTTVYMTLLDENGLKITDTQAYRDSSTYISWLAEPGKTYYLQFSLYDKHRSGNYTVSLACMADNEGNDIASAAQPALNAQTTASFDGTGDVDFFTFTAGEGDPYYNVSITNESVNASIYMTLLDQNGLKLTDVTAYTGNSAAINWQAATGDVFYLSFTRSSDNKNGAYVFTIDEIADSEPDVLSDDAPIDDGASTAYMLGGSADADWFLLSAPEASSYISLTVTNDGSDTIAATLTDAAGSEIDSRSISRQRDWSTTAYSAAGTPLYLRITGKAAGKYTIARRDTLDIGGSSTGDAAKPLPGEPLLIVFEQDNEQDYAAFPAAGANILLTAAPDSSLYACVIDAHGQRLTDEFRLYSGDSRLLSADREGLYLALRGRGGCTLNTCTPQAHSPGGAWLTTKASSCIEEGEQVMLCTVCQQPAVSESLPAAGHTPAAGYTVVRAAGCDDPGLEELRCTLCHAAIEQRSIPATGHLNSAWVTVLEAGCESDGLQRRICSDCGKQLEQERIPATGHFPGAADGVEPTCSEDGYTQTVCRLCGDVLTHDVLPAAGHVPGEMCVTLAPGCESEGLQAISCLSCGQILEQQPIPATGHAYGEWVQTVAPTRSEEGREESVCANCGAAQTRPVEKLTLIEGIFGR